jgi:hypothetical protein
MAKKKTKSYPESFRREAVRPADQSTGGFDFYGEVQALCSLTNSRKVTRTTRPNGLRHKGNNLVSLVYWYEFYTDRNCLF